ncbi:DUF5320 domain-containing protein [bacterium]|nr:DUF5320 domain-containing protein [bacterium]
MPRGDRTGPMGQGPMTGRRAGYCSGSDMPGSGNRYPGGGFGPGQGFGGGLGYGRGFRGGGRRNRFYATGIPGNYPAPPVAPDMAHEQELALLKGQADALTQAMDDIHKRIDELEKGG